MSRAFIYVVDRDFGFAPNPFHGICTLATCKPRIRSAAKIGDWVVGMGGGRLKSNGHCIFAMRITAKLNFNDYWAGEDFRDKIPVRNGSFRALVGDNIYHQTEGRWHQADSHHSLEDGSPNPLNLNTDTSVDAVLISDYFYYFGREAPVVPHHIISGLGYVNGRNHRTFELLKFKPFLDWVKQFPVNQVIADPFDFAIAASRYAGISNRIIR